MSLVEIKNISAGYNGLKDFVIEDISFELLPGQMLGLIGLNGSGKSTFIKALCGLIPSRGEALINGQATKELTQKELSRRISYIPQKSGISLDMPVLDVVLMGFNPRLKLLENPSKMMIDTALEMLEKVGLGQVAYKNYMLLSEGQKQLVILARALVSEGNLLVMDEPESALDFNVRYKMMKLVKEWIKEGDRGGIVSLHDTGLALNCCDKLVLLKDKKIAGIIDTKSDTISFIEENLKKIYGQVKLIKTSNSLGQESLVMINDSEEV